MHHPQKRKSKNLTSVTSIRYLLRNHVVSPRENHMELCFVLLKMQKSFARCIEMHP